MASIPERFTVIIKKKNIGRFRRRIRVEKQAFVSDGMGGQTVTWSEDFKVWAQIEPISGRQKLDLDAISSTVSHVIRFRCEEDVTNENRIIYNGREFNIQYVVNVDEDSTFYEIGANEGSN